MRTDIRAVIFDLDGTLLDRRSSFELFARNQWIRFKDVLGDVEQPPYVDATGPSSRIRIEAWADYQWLCQYAESQARVPEPGTRFDTILISEIEGISKPDLRIFRRACEQLNTDPAQAVYVGDHPEVDVAGARAAGMRTVWRRGPGLAQTVESDTVIGDMDDLLVWLRV